MAASVPLSSQSAALNSSLVFKCFVCSNVFSGDYKEQTKHFRLYHGFKTSGPCVQPICCGRNGCRDKFSSWNLLNRHVAQIHYQAALNNVSTHQQNENENVDDSNSLNTSISSDDDEHQVHHQQHHEEENQNDDQHQNEQGNTVVGNDSCRVVSAMMLDLRAHYQVSHEALNFMAEQLTKVLSSLPISQHHHSFNGSSQCNNPAIISHINGITESLSKLRTQKKRHTYFVKHYGLLTPETCALKGIRFVPRTQSSIGTPGQIMKTKTFHYISLRKYFTVLFSRRDFRELYFSERPSVDGFMRSHRDGSQFKLCTLFQQNPHAIRIQLFGDEVETTNPLGSKIKKHELMNIYFRILNMPVHYNSKLSSIMCLASVNTSLLEKESAYEEILQQILFEILDLESLSGMRLDLKEFQDGFLLRGTVVHLTADTKGAHQLLGFIGPSANCFCRQCLIHRADLIKKKRPSQLEMRTRENYDQTVLELNGAFSKTEKENITKTTGMSRGCILNKSLFFHAAENYCFDAMHDILEGVSPFLLKLCIRQWVMNPPTFGIAITAELLNQRINTFSYSLYDQKNKPSARFTTSMLREEGNYSTKQRAAQNWCLFRCFPLIVGDIIPENDPYLNLIFMFLDIMGIILSPRVSLQDTYDLEIKIEIFYEEFHELFPDVSPINKFHHLLHYPECIRRHGPSITNWCMRFESLHNTAKRIARVNHNYINLSLSVAEQFAIKFCSDINKPNAFSIREISIGKHTEVPFYSAPPEIRDANLVTKGKAFSKPVYININGFHYRENSIVLLKFSRDTKSCLPKFGKILGLFVQEKTHLALISVCKTVQFDKQFHCYQIKYQEPELISVINLLNLTECGPLWPLRNFKNNSPLYVSPRHYV